MTETRSEPSVNDLNPLIPQGVKREVAAWIDRSGSMTYPAAPGSDISRQEVLGEALGLVVAHLEGEDSQAEQEQADGSDEEGGVLALSFADNAKKIGDMNSSNWRRRWAGIQWGGGTRIMPCWDLAQELYLEEFGDLPMLDRPALETLIFTDGEAEDAQEFGKVLAQAKAGRVFAVAILGYGKDHDATLEAYRKIEKANPKHVRVVTFAGETDPVAIANDLKLLVGND